MSDEVTQGRPTRRCFAPWDEARDLVKRLEGSSVHRFVVAAGNCKIEIERGAPAPIAMPAEGAPPPELSGPLAGGAGPGLGTAPEARAASGCSRWAPRPRRSITGSRYWPLSLGPTPPPSPARIRSSRSATPSTPARTVCIVEAMKLMNGSRRSGGGRGGRDLRRERRAGRVRAGPDVPRACRGWRRDVREGPDRQPGRDRAGASRARAGSWGSSRSPSTRPPTPIRRSSASPTRRFALAAAAREELSAHPEHHRRPEQRCRRAPSGLRLPLRGSLLRRDLRQRGDHLHRPEARRDGEGRRQGDRPRPDEEGAAAARDGRSGRHRRRGAGDRRFDRIPGDHQGGRGGGRG